MRPPTSAFILLLICAVSATGCSQPYQAESLFGLGSAPAAQAAAARKDSLAVSAIAIAPPCDCEQFTYRYADGRMRNDDYAGFIAPPAALLGTTLTQRLAAAGVFQTVIGPQTSMAADFSLVVSIDFLGVDFDAAGTGAGLLTGRAWLLDGEGRSGKPVFQWEHSASSALTANTPDAVAQALSAATDSWLDALAAALRSGAPSAP